MKAAYILVFILFNPQGQYKEYVVEQEDKATCEASLTVMRQTLEVEVQKGTSYVLGCRKVEKVGAVGT